MLLVLAGKCPHPRGQAPILHGSTVRNYTTRVGLPDIELPGAAVIVFVVDESGSMVGEHKWLRETVIALEQNLRARQVGVSVRNEYALVGFAHDDRKDSSRRNGKVLQGCSTAEDVANALGMLNIDGRLEDGYSAISIGLDQLPCLQNIQQRNTGGFKIACQIILATDEGRDVLNATLDEANMLARLRSLGCVLNIVINERMRGRMNDGQDWAKALGVASNNQAVIVDSTDSFRIVPQGEAIAITGHENTHDVYVELAMNTSGAAWDLDMLRTEQYKQSFTNGFIEVKVQEIRRQIIGQCDDCVCKEGFWECREIGEVSGESSCLFPPSTYECTST